MLRSLRFRLPALFLLGIVLAAVVATLIAVRFFQSNTRTHAASELRAESAGIVQLYEQKAGDRARLASGTSSSRSAATGCSGFPPCPEPRCSPARCPSSRAAPLPADALRGDTPPAFDFDVRRRALSRRRAAGHARVRSARGARRRRARIGAAQPLAAALLGARARVRDRDSRRRRPRRLLLAPDRAAARGARRARRTRSPPATTTSPCRSAPGAARSSGSPLASTR